MKRTPIPHLKLKASDPLDLAFQIGKIRAKTIQNRLEHWNTLLDQIYRENKDHLQRITKCFFDYAKKDASEYVEEIRALALGSGTDFNDLFRFNITELKYFTEKCTTLIFPIVEKTKKGILIAHNEDWEPAQNDVIRLSAKLPDVSYDILTYDGYLPGLSCGANSHGLIHAVNFVRPKDLRPALPRIFITRYFLTAKSISDCTKWITSHKRAFGQSIHLAQRQKYTGIEITAQKTVLRRVQLPTVHANHYLAPSLKIHSATASESSLIRQKRAKELLTQIVKNNGEIKWTKESATRAAQNILCDRETYPLAIWREADNPQEPSATVAMSFLSTLEDEMTVYRQKPVPK